MEKITGAGGAVQLSYDDGRFYLMVTWKPAEDRGPAQMGTVRSWLGAGGALVNEVQIILGGGA